MSTIKLLFEILLFSTLGSRDYPESEKPAITQNQTYFNSIRSEKIFIKLDKAIAPCLPL